MVDAQTALRSMAIDFRPGAAFAAPANPGGVRVTFSSGSPVEYLPEWNDTLSAGGQHHPHDHGGGDRSRRGDRPLDDLLRQRHERALGEHYLQSGSGGGRQGDDRPVAYDFRESNPDDARGAAKHGELVGDLHWLDYCNLQYYHEISSSVSGACDPMKSGQQFRGGPSVGLEITPTVIRAVEIKLHGREMTIQRLAHGAVPAGSVRGGRIIDPAALAAALRDVWEKGRFSTRRCGVAVPVGALAPQMLTLPPAPAAEQRRIVAGELARFAPVQSSTPFGWLPMGSGGGPGGNTLAFLADAEMIAGYRQALAAAGLEVAACEPDAMAALRAVELGLRQQSTAAAVYVSPTCSEMAFLEAGHVRYYRRLDLGLGERAARGTIRNSRARSPAMGPARGCSQQRAASWMTWHSRSNVRCRYYARAYGSAPQPQKVLLLGDSPDLQRLAEVVHANLALEAEYLHPLHLYPHAPEMADPHLVHAGGQYSVALGMALRPLAHPQTGLVLDLLGGDDLQVLARRAPGYLMAALSGSSAVVLLALAASLTLSARVTHAQNELNAAAAELRAVGAEHATTVVQMRQVRIATDRLRAEAMPVSQVLTRLGGMVPGALALTNVQLTEDGSLLLEGNARAPQQVNGLLQQLSDDFRFRSPELNTLDANGQDGLAYFKGTDRSRRLWEGRRPEFMISLDKLTPEVQRTLAAAVPAAVVLFAAFLVTPKAVEYSAVSRQLAACQQNADLQKRQNLRELAAAGRQPLAAWPETRTEPLAFLKELNRIVATARGRLVSYRPPAASSDAGSAGPDPVNSSLVKPIGCEVTVSGSFVELVKLFQTLAQNDRLFVVQNLQVRTEAYPRLAATFRLVRYVSPISISTAQARGTALMKTASAALGERAAPVQ